MKRRKRTQNNEIKHINPLVDRYKRILRAPQGSVVNVFCSVVKEELGLTLEKEHISYTLSTQTLNLAVPGPAKSEVLLYKGILLQKCTEVLGEKSAPKNII